ncbi:MAG: ABC transporter permease [Desulfurococcales archaeon]|nr:ABC transporter permease [Desulfurococcales archaeon]
MVASQVLSEVYVVLKSLLKYRDLAFWTIIFPIIVTTLLIGIFAREGPSFNFDIAIEDRDGGWFSRALINALESTGAFNIVLVEGGVEDLVSKGEADVGLVIPSGASESIAMLVPVELQLYYVNGVEESETAKAYLDGVLNLFAKRLASESLNRSVGFMPGELREKLAFLVDPIIVEGREIKPEAIATVGGLRAYYAISIIGVQVLYIGIFSSISMTVERRKEGVFPVILSSPVRGWVIFVSDTLATLVLVIASAVVVTLTGLVLGADYSRLDAEKILASLGLLFIGTVSMIGLGLLVSSLARTSEGAVALGNLIAFPMMFLGGFVVPKFILPEPIQVIAEVFPLSRLISAVRAMAVYDYTVAEGLTYALPGILMGITLYMLGALIYHRLLTRISENPY